MPILYDLLILSRIYFLFLNVSVHTFKSKKPRTRHDKVLINYDRWKIKKGPSRPNHEKHFKKILSTAMSNGLKFHDQMTNKYSNELFKNVFFLV